MSGPQLGDYRVANHHEEIAEVSHDLNGGQK